MLVRALYVLLLLYFLVYYVILRSMMRRDHQQICSARGSFGLLDLEDHLIKHAVHDRGLVVVDKPVGVSYDKGLLDADSLNPGKDVCIKSAVPALKKHLKINELHNVRIPERNISGVTIFAESEELGKKVQKWWRVMRVRNEATDVYHAVVVGQPKDTVGFFNGSISLKTKDGVKRVVLSEEVGQNAVKRGEEKRVTIGHRVLASSADASLVEVRADRVKWNCVRVYLASWCLAPVLGDSLYGVYVAAIFGTPTPVDLFGKSLLPKQKMTESLRNRLEISSRKDVVVPLHLHLSTVNLMRNKYKVSQYSFPHPQVFDWTLQRLGLSNQPLLEASAAV